MVLRERWALVVLGLVFVEGAVVIGVLTYVVLSMKGRGPVAHDGGDCRSRLWRRGMVWSRLVHSLVGWFTPTASAGGLLVAGWAGPALSVTLATAMIGGLLRSGSWAFLHSTLQNWATAVVPHERATMIALFATTLFLGNAAGTKLASPWADTGSFGPIFQGALAAAAVVGVPAPAPVAVARSIRTHRGGPGD